MFTIFFFTFWVEESGAKAVEEAEVKFNGEKDEEAEEVEVEIELGIEVDVNKFPDLVNFFFLLLLSTDVVPRLGKTSLFLFILFSRYSCTIYWKSWKFILPNSSCGRS